MKIKKVNRKLSHSQNFLKSPEFVGNLIDKTTISDKDLVVEIGPGRGAITLELAKRASRVIGVEYDQKLASSLKSRFANNPKVEIVQADFLRWNLPKGPYKVFANIPFNMTADMVNRLLFASNPPQATYLIMQDRAAERFIGTPVFANSQISILLQPFYDMSVLVKIDRREFRPIPKINAVLAGFIKKYKPTVDMQYRQLYRDFVIYGYNQWQPTILDAFREIFTKKQLDLVSKKFDLAELKPSELTIDQWLGIFEVFIEFAPKEKRSIVSGAEKRLRFTQRRMQKQYRTRIR